MVSHVSSIQRWFLLGRSQGSEEEYSKEGVSDTPVELQVEEDQQRDQDCQRIRHDVYHRLRDGVDVPADALG